jgi:predicted RNase H-like HicB family nuclease
MAVDYALYLESGPKRRKTMVHVPQLLGCVAVGPTTEQAIEDTPEAISAYLRFLKRAGEDVDPDSKFTTHVEEHITEGTWLGNGDPYISFGPDFDPLSEEELRVLTRRVAALREELAAWAEGAPPEVLDGTVSGSSRSSRAILLHVLGPTGAYLAPIVGTIRGVSRLHTQAERGEISLPDALRQSMALVVERLNGVTEEQRTQPVQRPKEVRTLRKSLRRTLEHDWEHLAELSRRPGGPSLA